VNSASLDRCQEQSPLQPRSKTSAQELPERFFNRRTAPGDGVLKWNGHNSRH